MLNNRVGKLVVVEVLAGTHTENGVINHYAIYQKKIIPIFYYGCFPKQPGTRKLYLGYKDGQYFLTTYIGTVMSARKALKQIEASL